MSNNPVASSGAQDLQGEYPPGPPPPLPPRRPLPPLYDTAGNVHQGPSEPVQNTSTPPQQAFGNTGPHNQGYFPGYGGHPSQYPQPSTNPPTIPPNPPSHQFQNTTAYGQNSAYPNASPYGHALPNQPFIYGQYSSSHEQTLASPTVPYGQGINQGHYPSPYGPSASPNLIQQPFYHNIPPVPYAPAKSPPVPKRPTTAQIQQSSYMRFGSNEHPSVSEPPTPPLPFRPWSAAGLVTPSGAGTQSAPRHHPDWFVSADSSSPGQQSFNVSTVNPSSNPPSSAAVSTLQRPASIGSPPPHFTGPAYQAVSGLPIPETTTPASLPPPTNQYPTPPTSTIPASLPSQLSPPPEISSHSADPVSPPPTQLAHQNPIPHSFDTNGDDTGEETIFFKSSLERYRAILEKERSLIKDGKSSEVLSLLQEFMESEMKLRQERYAVKEEQRLETVPEAPISPPPTTVLPTNHVESSADNTSVKPQKSRDRKPVPPSTFAAILSQTYSYTSPPQVSDLEARGSQKSLQTSSTAPKLDYVQPVIPQDEETKIPSKEDPPAPKKFKEHTIPSVPQSESLAQILSGIPKSIENDPSLTPFRERLATLKDLAWLDNELSTFEDREHVFTAKSVEELGKRQVAHSVRKTQLYAAGKWEIADGESREFDEETQCQKVVEMRHSLARWRTEYCDPSYEKLHANFASITELHKDITQFECDNIEEQVGLLNEAQDAFLSIIRRLETLTDELRQRQHQLKTSKARAADEWDIVNKSDKEKKEEDEALKEQRSKFKLDKVRLHAKCVKFLIDYGVEVTSDWRDRLRHELELLFKQLSEKAKSEELPSDDSTHAYPSEELIEQFSKAAVVLNRLNRRINSLLSLLEQSETDLISEESQPAIIKAYNLNDWSGGENLRAEQTSREKALVEANTQRRKERDAKSKEFSDRLATYVTAHSGRKKAR